MNIHAENENKNPFDETESLDQKRKLLVKANKWSLERLMAVPPRIDEAKARMMIVSRMGEDLSSKKFDKEQYKKQCDELRFKLQKILGDESFKAKKNRKDSITHQAYEVRIIREEDAYVAEEVLPDGSYISQVRLFDDNESELTLHYDDNRYKKLDADIFITVDKHYPRASLKTMELLIGLFR